MGTQRQANKIEREARLNSDLRLFDPGAKRLLARQANRAERRIGKMVIAEELDQLVTENEIEALKLASEATTKAFFDSLPFANCTCELCG